MRIQDIIKASLDRITTDGLLTIDAHAHAPYEDDTRAPLRSNSIFTPPDLDVVKRTSAEPFAGDSEAWRHAYEFVEQFTATSAAGNGTENWELPQCLGPFSAKPNEIYEPLCFAVERAGLRQFTPRNTLHMASFEATQTLALKKLPRFYGLYLLAWKSQQNPWNKDVDLRVQVDLTVEPRPGGSVASLAMTAPAVSVVASVEHFAARFVAPTKSPMPGATRCLLREIASRWGRPAAFP
jgi:hypothetical protein